VANEVFCGFDEVEEVEEERRTHLSSTWIMFLAWIRCESGGQVPVLQSKPAVGRRAWR